MSCSSPSLALLYWGAVYLCATAMLHLACAIVLVSLPGSSAALGDYERPYWGMVAWSLLSMLCVAALELSRNGRGRAHASMALCALGRIACLCLAGPSTAWFIALLGESALLPAVESLLLGRDRLWRLSRTAVTPSDTSF